MREQVFAIKLKTYSSLSESKDTTALIKNGLEKIIDEYDKDNAGRKPIVIEVVEQESNMQ